jgi:hypothetical protein
MPRGLAQDQPPDPFGDELRRQRLAAAVVEKHAAAALRRIAADVLGDAPEMRGGMARIHIDRMLAVPELDPVGR